MALLSLLAYLPGLRNGLVWDDDIVLLGNARLHPPTLETLQFYAAHPFWNLYMPVTAWLYAGLARWSAGFIDAAPPSAVAFHLAGAAAHAATSGLVFLILHHVTRSAPAAGLGAVLYAWHPVQVEAVAFAGALNNPVCGLFSMGAILGLCLATQSARPDRRRYAAATVMLLLALLSKPTAVVVPVMAVALAAIDLRRSLRTLLIWIAPWLALAGGFAVLTARLQGVTLPAPPLLDRLQIAGSGGAFYLGKIFWPMSLGIDYGRTPAAVMNQPLTPLLATVPIALIAVAIWAWRRGHRAVAATIVIYGVALLPNSGLVPFDSQQYSTNSDRYLYLAMLGPSLLLALLLRPLCDLCTFANCQPQRAQRCKDRKEASDRRVFIGGCGAILVIGAILLPLQQRQLATWKSEQTLFGHALTIQPNSWWTWGDLAHADLVAGRFPAAADEARRSVTLRPDSVVGWENLGLAERQQHHAAAAVDAFSHGLRLARGNPLAIQNYLDARHDLAATMPPR